MKCQIEKVMLLWIEFLLLRQSQFSCLRNLYPNRRVNVHLLHLLNSMDRWLQSPMHHCLLQSDDPNLNRLSAMAVYISHLSHHFSDQPSLKVHNSYNHLWYAIAIKWRSDTYTQLHHFDRPIVHPDKHLWCHHTEPNAKWNNRRREILLKCDRNRRLQHRSQPFQWNENQKYRICYVKLKLK